MFRNVNGHQCQSSAHYPGGLHNETGIFVVLGILGVDLGVDITVVADPLSPPFSCSFFGGLCLIYTAH